MDRREHQRAPDRRRDTREREERDRWCATRRIGDATATFSAGETLRCPAIRTLSRGGEIICGSAQGIAKPGTSAIIRWRRTPMGRLPYPGTDVICRHCMSPLEIFVFGLAPAPTAAAS